jgi:OOP family OmpA-OmpF porin
MSPRFALLSAALLLACFAVGNRCAFASGIPELPSVTFLPGHPQAGESFTASLDEFSRGQLERNLAELKAYPHPFALFGFTDDRECRGLACEALAHRRARGLYDWLIANGVDPAMLPSIIVYDETKPIDDNDTEDGRARNRRVEFQFDPVLPWGKRY